MGDPSPFTSVGYRFNESSRRRHLTVTSIAFRREAASNHPSQTPCSSSSARTRRHRFGLNCKVRPDVCYTTSSPAPSAPTGDEALRFSTRPRHLRHQQYFPATSADHPKNRDRRRRSTIRQPHVPKNYTSLARSPTSSRSASTSSTDYFGPPLRAASPRDREESTAPPASKPTVVYRYHVNEDRLPPNC